MKHIPVLLNETIDALQLKPGSNVIDCTLGDGGHTAKMLKHTAPNGLVLGIDADPESLARAKQFLYDDANRMIFVRENFGYSSTLTSSSKVSLEKKRTVLPFFHRSTIFDNSPLKSNADTRILVSSTTFTASFFLLPI